MCLCLSYIEIWRESAKEIGKHTRVGVLGSRHRPAVLYSDNLASHMDRHAVRAYKKYGMGLRYLIPRSTHLCQPVDQMVGKCIKDKMKKAFRQWRRQKEAALLKKAEMEGKTYDVVSRTRGNKATLSEMRRMVARWLADAVADVNANHTDMIRAAWRNTGLMLPMDGSNDDELEAVWVNNTRCET